MKNRFISASLAALLLLGTTVPAAAKNPTEMKLVREADFENMFAEDEMTAVQNRTAIANYNTLAAYTTKLSNFYSADKPEETVKIFAERNKFGLDRVLAWQNTEGTDKKQPILDYNVSDFYDLQNSTQSFFGESFTLSADLAVEAGSVADITLRNSKIVLYISVNGSARDIRVSQKTWTAAADKVADYTPNSLVRLRLEYTHFTETEPAAYKLFADDVQVSEGAISGVTDDSTAIKSFRVNGNYLTAGKSMYWSRLAIADSKGGEFNLLDPERFSEKPQLYTASGSLLNEMFETDGIRTEALPDEDGTACAVSGHEERDGKALRIACAGETAADAEFAYPFSEHNAETGISDSSFYTEVAAAAIGDGEAVISVRPHGAAESVELVRVSGKEGKISAGDQTAEYATGEWASLTARVDYSNEGGTASAKYSVLLDGEPLVTDAAIDEIGEGCTGFEKIEYKSIPGSTADAVLWDDVKIYVEVEKENHAPTVSINAPESISIDSFGGLEVTAEDSDGSVEKVELYVDGVLSETLEGSASGKYVFNPQITKIGSYVFKAVAYDDFGKTGADEKTVSFNRIFRTDYEFTDFEKYSTGDMPFSQASGFGNAGGNETTSNGIESLDEEHGKSFYAEVTTESKRGTSGPWVKIVKNSSDTVCVNFDLCLTAGGMTVTFISKQTGTPSVSNENFIIKDGVLSAKNGDSAALEANRWYHFSYTARPAAKKFSLTVTDSSGNAVLDGQDLAMPAAMKSFNELLIVFGGGVNGRTYIDNLEHYTETSTPTLVGISADSAEQELESVAYDAVKYTFTLSGGFKSVDKEALALKNDIMEIPIKNIVCSDNEISFELENPETGLETASRHVLTIGKNSVLSNGKALGAELELEFTTRAADIDLRDGEFSGTDSVSFSVRMVNSTNETINVRLLVLEYVNGVFEGADIVSCAVPRGGMLLESAAKGYAAGTNLKAFVTDENLCPVSNKVFYANIK